MSFEEKLRERLNKAPFRSKEKDLLKVVLGELQQKSASGKVTDEQGLAIVKSMIKNNIEKVLPHLKEGDERKTVIEEENKILQALLPAYLTVEQVKELLAKYQGLTEDIQAAKNDGQATGLAMKYLKSLNAQVEGETVKQAILELRA
jgi:uncharacterized protein YqeY